MSDKTLFQEHHHLLYRAVCVADNNTENYVGETTRRTVKTANDHNG